jgi:uncharacterized protein (DUF3820 family)
MEPPAFLFHALAPKNCGRRIRNLAQDMRNWFAVKPDGKPTSEGMERLYVELQAREGKADLSKIQPESVILWVVKQKFPPPAK